jgi:hypothetical protein
MRTRPDCSNVSSRSSPGLKHFFTILLSYRDFAGRWSSTCLRLSKVFSRREKHQ